MPNADVDRIHDAPHTSFGESVDVLHTSDSYSAVVTRPMSEVTMWESSRQEAAATDKSLTRKVGPISV